MTSGIRKRVLVFPCGSEVGLELYRSLSSCKEVDLWGASSIEDHGAFVYESYLPGLPFVDAPAFMPALNRVISDHCIDFIFPAHDDVVLRLAEAQDGRDIRCPVLTSTAETCRVCRSKTRTIAALAGHVPVPHVYRVGEPISQWPVFLKPDAGQGSRGITLAHSADELRIHVARHPDLVIQEYLAGPEYTVDCFTNAQGKLLFAGPRERLRIANGISVRTRPADIPELRSMAAAINEALRLRGVWFFQVKVGAHGPKLLEVASRVAGSMAVNRVLGVNLPLLAVYDAAGVEVKVTPVVSTVTLDRGYDVRVRAQLTFAHVYVDLDDCLVLKDKVNCSLVAFLYECANHGCRLHLLTRHRGSIDATLRKHRLASVFDSVVRVGEAEPKSLFITHHDSIFIDDSYSERTEVAYCRGIPSFSPDAVAALVVWTNTDYHVASSRDMVQVP